MSKKIEDIMKKYSNQAIVRSMINLIPSVGGAIDVYLTTTLKNIENKRIEVFFDELLKNNLSSDSSLLKSEEFLYKYFLTVQLALQTRQEEKIKMFAKMLSNSFDDKDIDEYEEYLNILNELSYRELFMLIKLDEYHQAYDKRFPKENKLELTKRYWDDFCKEISEKFNISNMEIDSLLVRLSRSGCYQLLAGEFISPRIGQGTTTEVWNKLKSKI